MLVEYTPIASLSPSELNALKNATIGLALEGRGSHFSFMGKTFSITELKSHQAMWEQERNARRPGQQLNG